MSEEDNQARVDARRITGGLVDAGLALASALSIEHVLRVLVDVARELIEARYAALGVLNAEGTALSDFITSGMTAEQRARIGDPPRGHGILGVVIREARPLRLGDLTAHPASYGVPANHPPMRSFLGVPVMSGGRVFGNLYLTEKQTAAEFSEEDVVLVQALAAQAAIAIENAQLRRARDRFFAAASHELGNALAGVRLWSRYLLSNPPDSQEGWRQGMNKVLTAAEQTSRLVEDLLSLSRIQEGRLILSPWAFDVLTLAEETLDDLRPEAEAAGVRLTLAAKRSDQIVLEQDPVRVRQILVNLAVNAIKFSTAGGEVRLAIDPHEAGARVVVADSGPGVAPEAAERIFEPYEQVTGVARGRGSGLGLPLSRQLARLMGGDLWVDLEAGPGASFVLQLPPAPARTATSRRD